MSAISARSASATAAASARASSRAASSLLFSLPAMFKTLMLARAYVVSRRAFSSSVWSISMVSI